MSEQPRTVKVTRAQTLAAQLIEKLDRLSGADTDPGVTRLAQAGRDAGVLLPSARGKAAPRVAAKAKG